MGGIENTIVARLEKHGEKFELLVDPKLSYEYKTGQKKDLNNVLCFEEVFKDARKGERQTSTAIKKVFGTEDIFEIARIVFRDGELQLTTDQRRKLVEEKHAKLVTLIAANCVDPRTKAPHPPNRIEKALEEARFHVDAFKTAQEQMNDAIESIREIIPISTEKARVALKVPAQFAPKAYGTLKEYGIKKEEWANDGSLIVLIEVPAGSKGEFLERINKLTGGQVESRDVR